MPIGRKRAAALAFGLALIACAAPPGARAGTGPEPFTDEAFARGVVWFTQQNFAFGFGAAFGDLDGDGDPDLVLIGSSAGVVGLFENDGDGIFTNRYAGSGIPALYDTSGVGLGDYDADGDPDLYITRWGVADVFYRNDGNFVFTDVTAAAGLGDTGAGEGVTWADYDNDGDLDLFLANRTGSFEGLPPGAADEPNRLYRNNGDGTFTDVMVAAGIADDALTFMGVWFDYEDDGDADLYVSNDKCDGIRHNRFWRNLGDGTFSDFTQQTNTGICMDSMGVAVGDFDANDRQDLYPTNTPEGNPLFLGELNGSFADFSTTAGTMSFAIGWGTWFFDYDNDGYLELYVNNQLAANRLYDHDGSWPCANLATTLAVDDVASSYGGAVADIDDDGDLDMVVVNTPGPARLYINHEGELRNWIKLRVVGEGANRDAIGAVVRLRNGGLPQMREVSAGRSFKSQHELPLHFGLGTATTAGQLTIRWPGGATRTVTGFAANRTWTVYPPSRLGDVDGDGDRDRDDLARLVECQGPAGPGNLVAGCEIMDFDGDVDVDAADVAAFLAAWNGPMGDCNGTGAPDAEDILDGTSADLDANGVPDECDALAAPAGAVAATSPGLQVARAAGGDVELTWGASCGTETDFEIYEGEIATGAARTFDRHLPATCSTAHATTWTLTPRADSTYYLVVPTSGVRSGSAGVDSAGGVRTLGTAPCYPQLLDVCSP